MTVIKITIVAALAWALVPLVHCFKHEQAETFHQQTQPEKKAVEAINPSRAWKN